MSEIIFEMTKDHLETGLRGIPVGYCNTSHVDPRAGLFYRGTLLKDLANYSCEEVIYLLYKGKMPNTMELKAFKQELDKRSRCSSAVVKQIQTLPRQGHPMKLFSCSLLILGMLEGVNNYKEDTINLIAKIPHLLATVINYHAGWGHTPEPHPQLGYMENFVHMLNIPNKNIAMLNEVMRLFNVLHYDHGGGNLSTFVGKAVASGLEDLYGSIAASMCALEGPRHGGANESGLEFAKEIYDALKGKLTGSAVEELIRKKLANNEVIFGFGHAVLRVEDPRATIFYEFGKKHFAEHPLVKTILLVREYGSKVLKENPKISDPYTNVDAASGTILSAAGFNYPEYFTTLFGMSRVVGIGIQIVYERCEARGGKGTPIVRPEYIYKPS
ncbi:MAG: citrate (Si)-synthase [Chlamydiales bacterium]|nr:citrate (Si)-synthase [Chlamydiales bacterium]